MGAGVDTSPSDGAATDAADSAGDDSAGEDTFVPECVSNDDCKGKVLGVTSCRVPFCESGICTLQQLDKDTPCTPSAGAATECEVAQCNSTGTCAIDPRADGEGCGPYKCGKQCKAGKCESVGPEAYDDGNPCTNDYCKDGNAVINDPISDVTSVCEDGDACTKTGFCFDGKCETEKIACDDGLGCTLGLCKTGEGCKFLPNDAKCDDGDACTHDKCDAGSGCVVAGYAEATVTCDDGNTCTSDDHCGDKGACIGTAICACTSVADCKQDNLCLGEMTCDGGKCVVDTAKAVTCTDSGDTECDKNACDPKSGGCAMAAQPDGQACNDGSACTTKSACDGGECLGTPDVDCNDGNPCTDDACDALVGCAKTPVDAVACDDKSACTTGDVCSKGACVGTPKNCDDGVPCTGESCDPKTGTCSSKPQDSACDDGNPCTTNTCDAKAGCGSKANDAAKCDDGNSCTDDACKAGACVGNNICECKTAADCDDGNPCTDDACNAGKCSSGAVGDGAKKACDTGDKCQVAGSGVCVGGACTSGNKPKDCSGSGDACTIGVCEPKTGNCIATAKSEGTSCDADADGCTVSDFCKAGKCTAGAGPDCSKAEGPCTQAICVSAGKTGYKCEGKPRAKGFVCDDGAYCTQDDSCDGAGKCAAGSLRSCAGVADVCNDGVCNEVKKLCEKKPKSVSAACEDGKWCTENDQCAAGVCKAGPARACADDGTCTVGFCDEDDRECDVKDAAKGTSCDDGNKCTASDACDGDGECDGASTVPCKGPAKACQTQVCNPLTGGCDYKPIAKGLQCDDGEKCTLSDTCDGAGSCVPGKWDSGDASCGCQTAADCNDGNACTKDSCADADCVNAVDTGASCDDGDSCSTASACNADGACAATKKHDCGNADACNVDTCDGSGKSPKCGTAPKPKGTGCNDGNFCTTASACDGVGGCAATKKRSCADGKKCTQDVCNEDKNTCEHPAKPCGDGNPCTKDTCIEWTGQCYHPQDTAKCDDANACTNDACNPANGACGHANVPDGRTCAGGDACKQFQCSSGSCKDANKPQCNDNNPCTLDQCNVENGKYSCSFPVASGASCDDNDVCTNKDTCSADTDGSAQCIGSTKVGGCDDENSCTVDTCSPSKGCEHAATNEGKDCSDDDKCTVKDECKGGKCEGIQRTCDDKTPCTYDKCDAGSGECVFKTNDSKCHGPPCNPAVFGECPKSSDPCLRSECVPRSGSPPFHCIYQEKCG